MNDTNARSVIKTITWRITGSGATFLIVFLMTGSLAIAGSIGIIQLFCNTILYFVHERIWNIVKWGRTVNKEDYK